jgi:hypothetical protein
VKGSWKNDNVRLAMGGRQSSLVIALALSTSALDEKENSAP